jgi:hypothetical protein
MARMFQKRQPSTMLSQDETCWKLINNGFYTVANKGSDSAAALLNGDPNTSLTAIVTVDAAGRRLPIWIIAQPQTERCEMHYQNKFEQAIHQGKFYLTHQATGWTNSDICTNYLHWRQERVLRMMTILWECYNADKEADVKAEAA